MQKYTLDWCPSQDIVYTHLLILIRTTYLVYPVQLPACLWEVKGHQNPEETHTNMQRTCETITQTMQRNCNRLKCTAAVLALWLLILYFSQAFSSSYIFFFFLHLNESFGITLQLKCTKAMKSKEMGNERQFICKYFSLQNLFTW